MNPPELSTEDYYLTHLMDDMRDEILGNLSRLERAALAEDFAEFRYQWLQKKGEDYAEARMDE